MNRQSPHPRRRRVVHNRRHVKGVKPRSLHFIMDIAIVAAAALLVVQTIGMVRSCSARADHPAALANGTTVMAADSAAWNLGIVDGTALLDLRPDSSAMADKLLEVRGRETDFTTRLRPSAAKAYVDGFESAIRHSDPQLAKSLFD